MTQEIARGGTCCCVNGNASRCPIHQQIGEPRVEAGDRALEVLPHEFTKKPVTIWAVRYDGTVKSAHAICDWVGCAGARFGPKKYKQPGSPVWDGTLLQIRTLESGEGYHEVSEGDFVIKGVKGEFYPCKPDIFAATYSAGQSAMNAQERELRTILRARADKAYCDFIEAAKKQECLGYVAKLQAGTFGAAEHKAHKDAAELFGQHKAFAEAERLLAERGEGRC